MINQQNLVAVLAAIAQDAVEQIRASIQFINDEPEAFARYIESAATYYRDSIRSIRSQPRVAEMVDSWKEIPFHLHGSLDAEIVAGVRQSLRGMLDPIGLAVQLPLGPVEWRDGAGSRTVAAKGMKFATVLSLSDIASGIKVEVYSGEAVPDPRGGEGLRCGLCFHVARANSSPA